jgi:ribose 5-phosphate isomerase
MPWRTRTLTWEGCLGSQTPESFARESRDDQHRLEAIPGSIEHGLFLSEIDIVFVGRGARVDTLTR